MKKKSIAVLLMMSLALGLVGCGSSDSNATSSDDTSTTESAETTEAATTEAATTEAATDDTASTDETSADGYELALVTDVGTIDDKSFNQGAWEGLKQYADDNSISCKYYQPSEKTTAAYIETIGLAVEGGAKLIVCPGYLFEPAVYECQDTYPDVDFILLDGTPHSEDYSDYKCNDNVYAVSFAEEQAGFLAGYAAVKDGYTELGFMGGMAMPAVMRYGYGYIQGADYAASELGIDNININYTYTGGYVASPEVQSTAASWYNNGTEVIFGCGGGLGNSVMAAAETAGTKVIGVDVDQRSESESTVITSAMKNLGVAVYNGVAAMYDGTFPGGQTVTLDATTEAVELPMDDSQFTTFTQDDYDTIYAAIVNGDITICKDTDDDGNTYEVSAIDDLCANVTVNYVE